MAAVKTQCMTCGADVESFLTKGPDGVVGGWLTMVCEPCATCWKSRSKSTKLAKELREMTFRQELQCTPSQEMRELRGIKIPRVIIDEVPCQGVHEVACVNCPSTRGTDPEVEDILKLPRDKRIETAFPCAWRPTKLCRGYWDKITALEK